MSTSTKFNFIFAIGLISSVAYFAYQQFKRANEVAELSCLSSIAAATDKALASGKLQINGKSRELAKEEINKLLTENAVGDCSRHEYVFEKVHIAIGEEVNNVSIWNNFITFINCR